MEMTNERTRITNQRKKNDLIQETRQKIIQIKYELSKALIQISIDNYQEKTDKLKLKLL